MTDVQHQPGPTIFTLLGVLLKIMKCVTPRGPATDTKSFSTFFFLTWHIKTERYRYGEDGRGKNIRNYQCGFNMEAHQCVYFEDITELSRQKVVIIQAKPFTCSVIWPLFSWVYTYTNL